MVLLVCVLILAGAVRCLGLYQPYLGNFHSYQLISASMTRFFVREHFSDLLNPKLDILVNGAPGLHLHYYPVASLVAALPIAVFGGPPELWGRLQAILFSLATVLLIYALGARMRDRTFGLLACAVYAFSPISVIYGQSFMNEAAGVFLVVLALYAFVRARNGGGAGWIFCGIAAAGLTLITRLNGFYLFLPLLAIWAYGQDGWKGKKIGTWFLLCLGIGILPLVWYGYTWFAAQQDPHVYNCMFPQLGRQAPKAGWNPDFLGVLAKTIATLDFTPFGLALLVIGLVVGLPGRQNRWLYVWFFSVLFTFFLIPQKIKDHNFYTLHLVPPAAFFIAGAVQWAWSKGPAQWKPAARQALACIAILLALAWSARYFHNPVAKSVLEENRGVREAAIETQSLVPQGALIVASRGSANCLLYYSDRKGWDFDLIPPKEVPYQVMFRWRFLSPEEVEKRSAAFLDPKQWLEFLRSEGAEYFIIATPQELERNTDFRDYLLSRYTQITPPGDPCMIFDLREKSSPK